MKNISLFLNEQKISVGIAFMLVMTIITTVTTVDTNAKLKETIAINQHEVAKATTTLSYNIIKFNLKDIQNMNDVKNEIDLWYEQKWGAQIGALQTLCDVFPSRLDSLMTEDVKVYACKLVD